MNDEPGAYGVEYTCVDCKRRVVNFGVDAPPIPARCYACAWIAEHVDPAFYDMARAALGVVADEAVGEI